jgi:hypothetical protein
MCFVWISEQTAIISLYSTNWLVFITETECVYCAVRPRYLNITQHKKASAKPVYSGQYSDWIFFSPKHAHRSGTYLAFYSILTVPFTWEVNRPGRQVEQSRPSSAKLKYEWSYTSPPPICLHGVDWGNFTLRNSLSNTPINEWNVRNCLLYGLDALVPTSRSQIMTPVHI